MDGRFEADQTSETGESGPRSRRRDSLMMAATVIRAGTSESFAIRVRNLSAGGLMAETPVQVTVDEQIDVEMRNVGAVRGKVAWVEAGRFGIAFDEPIDPQQVRRPVGTKRSDEMLLKTPPYRGRPGLGRF